MRFHFDEPQLGGRIALWEGYSPGRGNHCGRTAPLSRRANQWCIPKSVVSGLDALQAFEFR
jgi:hypothetical protein